MSKEFYVCPNCKSDNITAEPMESEGGEVWRYVQCEECEYRWIEVFEHISNWDEDSKYEIDEDGNPLHGENIELEPG